MPGMNLRKLDPRIAATLWIGLIYTSIPFVRGLREFFAARWPVEVIAFAVVIIAIGAGGAATAILRKRQAHIGPADLLWLFGVAAVIVLWIRGLMGQPEEAVHFLEYGVLGVLLYRSFVARIPDSTVYVAATLAGLLVGTVDEIIQWLTPGRFWDLRDIILNGGAVALVQIVIWRLVTRPTTTVSRSSRRLLCRLAAGLVLLLTLCAAATPQRLSHLSEYVPMPDRLANGVDAICEYGRRHTVEERTVFRSRLSSAELVRNDRDRAPDLAREIDASRGSAGPARKNLSPVADPFGYEIRIHLFARNRNLRKALAHQAGSPGHRRHMTTAWRENLILENSFGKTLELSTYRWGSRRRKDVESAQDPDVVFVSRAGAHLITEISEGQLRALLLSLFAVLAACDVFGAIRFRPESPTE